jgi:hypothetical protein
MPDVNTSGWMGYKLCFLGVTVVIIALIVWGIALLFMNGSTGYNSMGRFVALLILFVAHRLYSFFAGDGKTNSLKFYKDEQFKKMHKKDYMVLMAQITADIDILAAHTQMPALDARYVPGRRGSIAQCIWTCVLR